MLKEIQIEHYQKGPEDDHDGSFGSICTFILPYGSKEIYIKLKIYSVNGEDWLKILSFHD